MGEDTPHTPTSSAAAGERKYVENGLLFFINNKVNFMVHDDIILLCSDFYNDDEVAAARKIMYAEFDRPNEVKSFRGAMKKQNEIKDMVKFLSETVNDNVMFCITRCTQVPPVSTDYIDMAAINRHVSLLRSEMSVMRATQRRLDAKLELLDVMPRPSAAALEDVQQLTRMLPHGKELPLHGKDSPPHEKDSKPHEYSALSCEREPNSREDVKLLSEIVQMGRTNVNDKSSDSSSSSSEWTEQRHQRRKAKQKRRRDSRPKHEPGQRRQQSQDASSTRPRRRPAVIGQGSSARLGAAPAVRDVALFVSRMRPDVPVDNLMCHVKEIAGVEIVECMPVVQRHPNYKSYKVWIKGIERDKIKDLYDPNNWDSGLLVKRWYDN